ncbi:unnamed protein product [Calypogeia fissa]
MTEEQEVYVKINLLSPLAPHSNLVTIKKQSRSSSVWTALWSSDPTTQLKTFLWRVVSQGFYTTKKAHQIGRDPPFCTFCHSTIEYLPHIFRTCSFACKIWRQNYLAECRESERSSEFARGNQKVGEEITRDYSEIDTAGSKSSTPCGWLATSMSAKALQNVYIWQTPSLLRKIRCVLRALSLLWVKSICE